jgi:outer membrane protein assembly factor BamB
MFNPADTLGQNDHFIPSQSIADFNEVPKLKWEFKTNASIFSSPIASKNLVYFGNLDSLLFAIDIETGTEKWKFRTKGEIRSNVCMKDNQLFLNGGDGNLYALDKSTGKLLWTFQTKGERKYDFADYFHSSPVIKNEILYFGSGDGNMYAIDCNSGNCIWFFNAGNIIHTTPSIDNNKIFFGSFDGYVYALNLDNGDLIWKFKTVGHRYFPIGEVQGSPAVFNNLVFIGARDYNIYAIDQNDGFCHWNKAFTKGWGLSNTIQDSVLYTGSADERVLIAANPETGKEIWKIEMEFLVFGNNAFSKNILYTGTTNGKLHAFSRLSGEKLWSYKTDTYLKNSFKYFKPDDSYRDDIYSIIKSSEQFLEVECELGGVFSTPYISNDVMIFSSTNGTLYCLKR